MSSLQSLRSGRGRRQLLLAGGGSPWLRRWSSWPLAFLLVWFQEPFGNYLSAGVMHSTMGTMTWQPYPRDQQDPGQQVDLRTAP